MTDYMPEPTQIASTNANSFKNDANKNNAKKTRISSKAESHLKQKMGSQKINLSYTILAAFSSNLTLATTPKKMKNFFLNKNTLLLNVIFFS